MCQFTCKASFANLEFISAKFFTSSDHTTTRHTENYTSNYGTLQSSSTVEFQMLTFFQDDRWRSESDDSGNTPVNHRSHLRSSSSNLSNISASDTPQLQEHFSSSPTNIIHLSVPPPTSERAQQAQHTSRVNDEAAEHNTFVDDEFDINSFKNSNIGADKKTHGVSTFGRSSSECY